MRTTREGPQTGTHKAVVQRGHKEETDGGQGGGRFRKQGGGSRGGGRYTKRGAAQQAAVTEIGRLSRRPLHKAGGGSAGGRYRNRAAQQAAVTRSGRPLQAVVTGTMPWGRVPQQEAKRPKINGYIFNGHFPTDTSARSGVTAMQRPWPLVKGNGFQLPLRQLSGERGTNPI
jgi:hypothetical protein